MKTDKEIIEMFKKYCPEGVEVTMSYTTETINENEKMLFFVDMETEKIKNVIYRYTKEADSVIVYDTLQEKILHTIPINELEQVLSFVKEMNQTDVDVTVFTEERNKINEK